MIQENRKLEWKRELVIVIFYVLEENIDVIDDNINIIIIIKIFKVKGKKRKREHRLKMTEKNIVIWSY